MMLLEIIKGMKTWEVKKEKMKLREKKVTVFGRSIPLIAVVAVVFMIAIVSAALVETLSTATVTTREPITNEITDDLATGGVGWDPGDDDDVILTINNTADLIGGYGLIVTPTVLYPVDQDNVSITVGTPDGIVILDTGVSDYDYNITASPDDITAVSGNITYTIKIDANATAGGNLAVSFDVERFAPFAALP